MENPVWRIACEADNRLDDSSTEDRADDCKTETKSVE